MAALALFACADGVAPPYPGPTVTLRGIVHTLAGPPPTGLRARISTPRIAEPEFVEEVEIDARGRFVIEAPMDRAFELLIHDTDTESPRLLPSLRRFDSVPDGWEPVVLLLPTSWTIASGSYAGRRVEVSLDRIYAPDRQNLQQRFWWVHPWIPSLLDDGDPGPLPSLNSASWRLEDLPLPLFFERDERGTAVLLPITADDSVAVWAAANTLEQRLGMDLVRPVRKEDLPADTVTVSGIVQPIVRPVSINFFLTDAGTGAGGAAHACRKAGGIELGTACERFGPGVLVGGGFSWMTVDHTPNAQRTLQHELMHALGMGHTCFAPSLMSYCPSAWIPGYEDETGGNSAVSVLDAAYFQLFHEAHRRALELRPHMGLLETLQGERIHLLGKPPVPDGMWWT